MDGWNSKTAINESRYRYYDAVSRSKAARSADGFYYLFGGMAAAPIVAVGFTTLGSYGTLGTYTQGSIVRGAIDGVLQKSIRGDVDWAQTGISAFSPTAKISLISSNAYNFSISTIKGKFQSDLGVNIANLGVSIIGYQFGRVGEIAGKNGNSILGSFLGTDAIQGMYNNLMGRLIDENK
ncbi:hypothetical protein [Soonwooa purpurea]